jgi:hypothetical protein
MVAIVLMVVGSISGMPLLYAFPRPDPEMQAIGAAMGLVGLLLGLLIFFVFRSQAVGVMTVILDMEFMRKDRDGDQVFYQKPVRINFQC